jgi:predicted DNA-binding transcriptional regulator YafY
MDWRIVNFLTQHQYKIAEEKLTFQEKIKLIEEAIKRNEKLDIIYLKASDEKSHRVIQPKKVGEMEYQGKSYIGVEGYCFKRKNDRVFRVDRILEMKKVNNYVD